MNWILKKENDREQLKSLLEFFGVANMKSWENLWKQNVAFRKSEAFDVKLGAVAAWIRKAEIEADKIELNTFDKDLFKNTLNEIRTLSCEPDPNVFIPELQRICANAGVSVVFVPELKGCRASGVTKWITSESPMIALSLRYKSNDHLWFTFFHEAGHILLHGKKLLFIEGVKNKELEEKEEEANQFASNKLIPRDKYQLLKSKPKITKINILDFSKEIGIAPGIVVGRLQHDKIIRHSQLNDLKHFYYWEEK